MGLNQRQTEVLQWIADGTPEREWPDWTHRSTARALQARGLVKVRGHGPTWTAVITDLGRRVLTGDAPAPHRSVKASTPTHGRGQKEASRHRPERVVVDRVELMSRLVDAPDHVLRITEPDAATRAGYRRALAAIPADLVPRGRRVTHTGRDKGDLVIRLVEQPDPGPTDPEVPLPDVADPGHPVISWLTRHPQHLNTSEASRDRALRIIAGLSSALAARGHAVVPPGASAEPEASRVPDDPAHVRPRAATSPEPDLTTFEVTIGDQVLAVVLVREDGQGADHSH